MVEHLYPALGNGVIGGEEKLAKTWYMLAEALALALGRPVLGRYAVPRSRRVLVIEEEDNARRTWVRLRALLRGDALDPDDLAVRHALHENFVIAVLGLPARQAGVRPGAHRPAGAVHAGPRLLRSVPQGDGEAAGQARGDGAVARADGRPVPPLCLRLAARAPLPPGTGAAHRPRVLGDRRRLRNVRVGRIVPLLRAGRALAPGPAHRPVQGRPLRPPPVAPPRNRGAPAGADRGPAHRRGGRRPVQGRGDRRAGLGRASDPGAGARADRHPRRPGQDPRPTPQRLR